MVSMTCVFKSPAGIVLKGYSGVMVAVPLLKTNGTVHLQLNVVAVSELVALHLISSSDPL